MSTIQTLREYFANEHGDRFRDLKDEDSLLDQGLLDSMAIVKLIAFLEERFGIELSDDSFDPGNFETLKAIDGLVEERLRQANGNA